MLTIYVDADACPVKDEIFRVAERYQVPVVLVANAPLRVPLGGLVRLVVVEDRFDAADDWIADQIGPDDIAITADIQLAARCLKAKARVIGPNGQPFTDNSIGTALAARALMQDLRDMGVVSGGPPSFAKSDRSRFLSALDQAINAIRRDLARRPG